jgi:hypothetical protein
MLFTDPEGEYGGIRFKDPPKKQGGYRKISEMIPNLQTCLPNSNKKLQRSKKKCKK